MSRTYNQVFEDWARNEVIPEWNARFPDKPPFDFEIFDGCTVGLDIALWACLLHDLAYHFMADRAKADRLLREEIIKVGQREDRFGWVWWVWGWTYWAAVRTFGGRMWRT